MATKESVNPQKTNFFVGAFLSLLGFSLAPEILLENDLPDKIDDALFFIIGLFAIFWYKKNSSKLSFVPVVLIFLGFFTKLFAIYIEYKDKEAVGDDIGIFIGLALALVLVHIQYRKMRGNR